MGITGALNPDFFEKAWNHVIRTNELLRVEFRWEKVNRPIQVILKEHKIQIQYYDLSMEEDCQKENRLDTIKTDDRKKNFDLQSVPFRVILCKMERDKYEMIISNHHIIYDGWSNGILLTEFFTAYNELIQSRPLSKLVKQKFKAYVTWLQTRDVAKQKEYWVNYLYGFETNTTLPFKKPNPGAGTQAVEHKIRFSKDTYRKIGDFIRANKLTMASLLYTVWGLLLQKYNNSDDVIFGTTVSGRSAKIKGVESIVGLFINTIPLRVRTPRNKSVLDLIKQVNIALPQREEFDNTPLTDIIKLSQSSGGNQRELFDSVVVLENYPLDNRLLLQNSTLSICSYTIYETPHYDLTVIINTFSGIEIRMVGNRELFTPEIIAKLSEDFKRLIGTILDKPGNNAAGIEFLTEDERTKILYEFNNTTVEYPKEITVTDLFEEQAARTPDKTAVVSPCGISVSYSQLNHRVNQLAHRLRKNGAEPGEIIGIRTTRSLKMVVGILGILKSGAAYLPVEPGYPPERLQYIHADSAMKMLITNRSFDLQPEFIAPVLDLDDEEIYQGEAGTPGHVNKSRDLAYIIYTSGSTGNPKGVMVEHRSLLNIASFLQAKYPFSGSDTYLLKTVFTFDVSITELFGWFLEGGKLAILPEGGEKEPQKILETVEREMITHINFSPSMFHAFLDNLHPRNITKLARLRYIFLAGERFPADLVRRFRQLGTTIRLENLYGPTEATVYASQYSLRDWDGGNDIPIGKPINNTRLYILDRHDKLQAAGLKGELCISGDGVARGYLNRPELTAQKFLANPFEQGQRLYKTGDVCRWMPDGIIEFFGRKDRQVKVRGYRIEPGEIENRLLEHEAVKKAAVIAQHSGEFPTGTDNNGIEDKYLSAYIVATRELSVVELRQWLEKKLPPYMVPSYFTLLEEFPVSTASKIDYKALPLCRGQVLDSGAAFAAPRNKTEEQLLEAWKEVLGKNSISIKDNFFDVGGDSIKAIRITSKMSKAGFKVTVDDIFKYPEISSLSPKIKKLYLVADQSTITGPVPLTPIQSLFFREDIPNPNHFNQSFMIALEDGFDEGAIRQIFSKIQEHHDALRMTFKKEGNHILQVNHGPDYPLSLQVFDLRRQENANEELHRQIKEIQTGIDIESGPLMKLGLFHLDQGMRLFIGIHHLVIDGISWRILFEDIESLYLLWKDGRPLTLPPKTDSFKLWSEALTTYSSDEKLLKETDYWLGLEAGITVPPGKTGQATDNLVKNTEIHTVHLSRETTKRLLTEVNHAFGTEIDDILLCALGLAFNHCFGLEKLWISLEGHGREAIGQDIDINRTIGWFTTISPIAMDFSFKNDPVRQIIEIKETLRRVPGKGIGYGILKYLTPGTTGNALELNPEPVISFNNLGQFDSDIGQKSYRLLTDPGNNEDENMHRKHQLEISGLIMDHLLALTIRYDKNQYEGETIRRLWDRYLHELRALISFCAGSKKKVLTPSDLTYKKLPVETVARLCDLYPVEDVYPLSPMQESMLFHWLLHPTSSIYFLETIYRFFGEVDLAFTRQSLAYLVQRHTVLRTNFVHDEIDRPMQVVLKNREVDIYFEDIRQKGDENEKEQFIDTYRQNNRQAGFDFVKDVLIRLAVIRVADEEYEFIWSMPHIIIDGWSRATLIAEFFDIYYSLVRERPNHLLPVSPYRDYIERLEKLDKTKLKHYWKEYLRGYTRRVGIPRTGNPAEENYQGGYRYAEVVCLISLENSRRLKAFANSRQITLNTIIQTLWAIILGRYNETRDVVMGIVVSGRPADIEGVESMVGLFINTVPLRIRFEEQMPLTDLLQQVQAHALQGEPYYSLPLPEIQSQGPLKQNLLDHILAFENYPITAQMEKMPIEIKELFGENSQYNFNVVVVGDAPLKIVMGYNRNIYDTLLLERIGQQLEIMIGEITENNNIRIEEIQVAHDFMEVNTNALREEKGDFEF